MTMAGPCEPGDVLGVIAGDFAVVGHDLTAVADDVLERLLGGGGELVTLVAGAEEPTERWPRRAPTGSRTATRLSTSWCTTGGRTATRCWSPWSSGQQDRT